MSTSPVIPKARTRTHREFAVTITAIIFITYLVGFFLVRYFYFAPEHSGRPMGTIIPASTSLDSGSISESGLFYLYRPAFIIDQSITGRACVLSDKASAAQINALY
jgi:hypothetical protein